MSNSSNYELQEQLVSEQFSGVFFSICNKNGSLKTLYQNINEFNK